MRIIVTLLILLLLYGPASAGLQQQFALLAKKNTSTGPTYLVEEDCEGTGTPAGWTNTGTVNWDDASAPLEGSQSLSISANYSYSTISFATIAGKADSYIVVNVSSLPASSVVLVYLLDGSSNIIGFVRLLSSGAVRIFHGTANVTTASVVSAGVTAYIWYDFTPGTGANGVANVYVSANTTKGSADGTVSTGTSTAGVAKMRVGKDDASGFTHTFDHIRLDDETIGDNPT